MQAPYVSIGQASPQKPFGHTRWLGALLLAGATLLGAAPPARANDGQILVATGLGAVAGALIGQSVGGRNGTIVGGAIGAAIGASAATENNRNRPPAGYTPNNHSGYDSVQYQGGYAPVAPVVYAPPIQVYRPAPVYQPVYQPVYRTVVRPVVVPVIYRDDYQYDSHRRHQHENRGRGHGHDNRRHDNYRNDYYRGDTGPRRY